MLILRQLPRKVGTFASKLQQRIQQLSLTQLEDSAEDLLDLLRCSRSSSLGKANFRCKMSLFKHQRTLSLKEKSSSSKSSTR